jgi:hypothetical protein
LDAKKKKKKKEKPHRHDSHADRSEARAMMGSHHNRQLAAAGVVVVVLVLVVSGGAAAFRADYSISSITQDEGTRLTGSSLGEWVGTSVSGGGDVDGDGVDDFVMSAYGAGQAYVVYGTSDAAASAWPTDTTIKTITQDSTRGRIIDGAVADTLLGQVVATVGDVNGDRLDDIAISSYMWNSFQGKVWVVWGKKRAEATTPLYVNTLDASKFVEITGEATDNWFGWSIAGSDFNHDGISDLLIGAYGYSSNTGRSYIVWGHNGTWPTTTINAADIGGTVSGVKITGEAASYSGISVANAGDVNHDGKTDLIIGAHYADPPGRTNAGRAYIVFGKDSGTWPTTINLGNLTAADGVIINGATGSDQLGWSVSGNVDVNGDNTADVIVGARFAYPDATK